MYGKCCNTEANHDHMAIKIVDLQDRIQRKVTELIESMKMASEKFMKLFDE